MTMRWLQSIFHRFRSLFRKKEVEQELDQEMRFHVERQIAENLAAGMSLEEARRAAQLEFGGAAQFKEECRDARGEPSRIAPCGSAVRVPIASKESRLHGDQRAHPCARHRHEHSHL
jgi:hypothetical protein